MLSDAIQIINTQPRISEAKQVFLVFHGIGGALAFRSLLGQPYSVAALSSWVINDGTIKTVIHEFGHLLGAGHAAGWSCGSSVVGANLSNITDGCTLNSRSDGQDIMGADFKHFSAAHKEKMGLLDPSQTKIVSDSGTFSIDALELDTTGLKQIKIPLGNNNFYSLEYRKPIGYDQTYSADEKTDDGVLLRLVLGTPVDENVDTLRPRDPQPLVINPGSPFTDSYRNIKVEVSGKSGNSAQVMISQ